MRDNLSDAQVERERVRREQARARARERESDTRVRETSTHNFWGKKKVNVQMRHVSGHLSSRLPLIVPRNNAHTHHTHTHTHKVEDIETADSFHV